MGEVGEQQQLDFESKFWVLGGKAKSIVLQVLSILGVQERNWRCNYDLQHQNRVL